jgi:Ca-activated chloride channel family protein
LDQKEVPLPLKHTDVRANISGYIGAVEVTQRFQNPYSSKIEAVYLFPLPHNAAIKEFIMTIGDRRIRGIIRAREEAEQIYRQARQKGYVASLLTQERPNVFTQSVANIEPGKEIDVNIKYFHTLEYVDGWFEFVFPMVVGPRFNPAGHTAGIGAVARDQSGASGQPTEVHYLSPDEKTGHQISLTATIDAGMQIEEFQCKTHAITHEQPSPQQLVVSLLPEDKLPNRDFVLRYRVASGRIKSTLLTSQDDRGGYFALMLIPPIGFSDLPRQPLELVFVIDCSGSMNGRPIQQAKAAVKRGLHLLQPGDSFQLITFSMTASSFGSEPLEATPENIRRALRYLSSLDGEGGTMMIEGIKAALDFPHDPERLRFVCFLTDGFIGNETEILAEIQQRLGASRIFSFGIGSSVNRYLIEEMARAGHGAAAFLGLRDEAATIMKDFFARISHPAAADLAIDWGQLGANEVFPAKVPDLFVGRPIFLTGRFTGTPDATISVNGTAAGQPVRFEARHEPQTATQNPALPNIWARMKIADLSDQSLSSPSVEWPQMIKQVALDYSLMSAFTAFVAVDSTRQTEGTESTTLPVAVPVPEGVNYNTTVKER